MALENEYWSWVNPSFKLGLFPVTHLERMDKVNSKSLDDSHNLTLLSWHPACPRALPQVQDSLVLKTIKEKIERRGREE